MFRAKVITFFLVSVCTVSVHAQIEELLDWRIDHVGTQYGNFDGNTTNGLERVDWYDVFNDSPTDADAANLVEFTLSAGTNQGVFGAIDINGNYSVVLHADTVEFNAIIPLGGNGGYTSIGIVSPADQQMGPGTATAWAAGSGAGMLVFDPTTVTLLPIANFTTNGTSVGWLKAYGYTNEFDSAALADPDSDSFDNGQEYQADTIPTNGADYPVVALASNRLQFATSTNCSYAMEWCSGLSSNAWNSLTNLSGTGADIQLPAVDTNSTRFFRLQIWRINP